MIDLRGRAAPHVHVLTDELDIATLGTDDVRVLEGERMATKADLMEEFARRLSLPDYFGRNWDALDECMGDLDDWLPPGDRVIVVRNAHRILTSESVEQLAILWRVLEFAGEVMSEPVARGEAWDRPARALHTLLVVPDGEGLRVLPSDVSAQSTDADAPPRSRAPLMGMSEFAMLAIGFLAMVSTGQMRYVFGSVALVILVRIVHETVVNRRGASEPSARPIDQVDDDGRRRTERDVDRD